ncbi:MAG TPA: NUMOD4 motif-containing HNH endonuclease [Urbifossiella sp.]|nr:NUMOD4 motif-containing HNH endonuclease [Urbifossiella sp.]
MTAAEEWRPVVGFEGWYEVSSAGRMRRVMPARGTRAGRIVGTSLNWIGYPVATLSVNGVAKAKFVHVLVAEAFLGPCPEKHEVNHINGVKADASVGNLEYTTHGGNMAHALRMGLLPFGEQHCVSKLTEVDVREIRRLRGQVSSRELGERYSVGQPNIVMIWTRRSWRHLAD